MNLAPGRSHERARLMATLNEYVVEISDHGIFRRNGVPRPFFSSGLLLVSWKSWSRLQSKARINRREIRQAEAWRSGHGSA